jgi:hypothetical protein
MLWFEVLGMPPEDFVVFGGNVKRWATLSG